MLAKCAIGVHDLPASPGTNDSAPDYVASDLCDHFHTYNIARLPS